MQLRSSHVFPAGLSCLTSVLFHAAPKLLFVLILHPISVGSLDLDFFTQPYFYRKIPNAIQSSLF